MDAFCMEYARGVQESCMTATSRGLLTTPAPLPGMVVKVESRKSTPQQLMAKALADLYARLSPTDVVRFNQLLSGISHNPGKLSAADQAMLSQVIRTLEQSVMADAHNMMPDLDTTSDSTRSPCDNADHEHSEDDFGGSSVGTLPPVEEEPGNSPRYVHVRTEASLWL
ncbi:unnamed protein product [Durusdinium trenchii]|uniref:Uncharacterized protein n=1 Tax=Durusdinium trenchii TaxID=1381693 RepID=A0ABP0J325_9DINO